MAKNGAWIRYLRSQTGVSYVTELDKIASRVGDYLQVDIIELKLFEARVNSLWDVGNVGYDLGRDKQLLPVHTAFFDG